MQTDVKVQRRKFTASPLFALVETHDMPGDQRRPSRAKREEWQLLAMAGQSTPCYTGRLRSDWVPSAETRSSKDAVGFEVCRRSLTPKKMCNLSDQQA